MPLEDTYNQRKKNLENLIHNLYENLYEYEKELINAVDVTMKINLKSNIEKTKKSIAEKEKEIISLNIAYNFIEENEPAESEDEALAFLEKAKNSLATQDKVLEIAKKVLILEPNFYGLGVDLKELINLIKRVFKKK